MSNIVTSPLTADSYSGRPFPPPPELKSLLDMFPASTVGSQLNFLPPFLAITSHLNNQELCQSNPTIFLTTQDYWMINQDIVLTNQIGLKNYSILTIFKRLYAVTGAGIYGSK